MSSSPSCCALPFSTFSVCLPPCAQQRPDAAPARLLCAPAACTSGGLLCFVCFRCCWSCRCCCWLLLPLLLPLLPLSNSACSPQQQLFLLCFQREDRLWQARDFFIRRCSCLRTRQKIYSVRRRPPLRSLLCLLMRVCAVCVCRAPLFTFPFSFRWRKAFRRAQ